MKVVQTMVTKTIVADPVPFLPDPVLEKWDPDLGDQPLPDMDPDPT